MSTQKGIAKGTFETKSSPQPPYDVVDGVMLGRMTIAKTFAGDFVGVGAVEMTWARTPVEGSAGYVAIERVTGTLGGRSGTFVVQHSGTMTRGASVPLVVNVVPDSATGDLAGLSGRMKIDVVDGKHFYELEYAFDAPAAT